ncbi:MAG TPA: DNA polymerase I [Gammaproteobacteria bacterium]|nr:DNA polymerase I [Gammaproteobacteria bacterium]
MSDRPLVLVDGSSYIYRAFHALPDLRNSADEPTGAIHGVLSMVQKLLDEHAPEHAAVVFDAPGKTFRDELYAEYKATREAMPDELRSQIQPTIDAIEFLGVPVLRIAGVEADDVIGTLAHAAARSGVNTIISTTDKDMTQLVDARTTVVNTMSNTVLDIAGVTEKFGVPPTGIVDYLTLVGDSSDNIPGVPGVGPKTAVKWLSEWGDLERVLEHAGEIRGKIAAKLAAAIPDLPLYKTLVTIKCDVELPVDIDQLQLREPAMDELREFFERYEMRTFLRRLEEKLGSAAAQMPSAESRARSDGDADLPDYDVVLEPAALDAWIERIASAEVVALDTETTSLNYMRAELVGISVAVGAGEAAYIPVAHDYPGAPEQLDREFVLDKLRGWLESADQPKVGHHIKYDQHIFENYGIELRGVLYDTMLESYVLNSTLTRHDMDSVAARYLGVQTIKFEDVAGKGSKQIGFNEVDLDTAAPYAAEDADITLRLHHTLWPKLTEVQRLQAIYTELEQPLIAVLERMEHTGVMVDAAQLEKQSAELGESIVATQRHAHELAGQSFNLGSPKQLQEILYEKLELPVLGKTPKGQPSTAESVLQELAADYELPQTILEYRALSKLKSTYTDRLPLEINPDTGRIHTSYHQAVAATGRLSSSEPNLQNIPIRTPEGRKIRQAFVAPQGDVLLAADYSQIELRIMAHLSGDESLRAAFEQSQDIHRATAAEVFGTTLDDVSHEQRRAAKAINFGLIYGMSAFGLARQLGIARGEAQSYVERYFERYPGVRAYMDATRERARTDGYVETVRGRRLYLPEINARNAQRRQYAERSAINAPMQGTAADIIKQAMLDVFTWLQAEDPGVRLIMQVHDELVFEVREAALEAARARIVAIMEGAAQLAVPLAVDVGIGANWDEAH